MKKAKRNVLVSAVLAIALCLSVITGATFALFTSKSSVNIAITSGNVEVVAKADGLKTYSMNREQPDGKFENGGSAVLDGNALTLNGITPGDKVTFTITVENKSTVTVKYRTRLEVLSDEGLFSALKIDIGGFNGMNITPWQSLAATVKDVAEFECSVELPVSAASEYKNKACAIAYTVEATQGNAETVNDTAYYTLAEFNALTEIPAGVKTAYVSFGNASLQGGLTIGNKEIADHYAYTDYGVAEAPAGYPQFVRNADVKNGEQRYIYSTGKNGFKVVLTGSVKGAADTGAFNSGCILLEVPDACEVVFDNVDFGKGQMAVKVWNETGVASMTVAHTVASTKFEGCTFNGNWMQNGVIGAPSLTFEKCTFNRYENTADKNNSNPIWIQNLGNTDVVIDGCKFNACRPIKLWEGTVKGSVLIKNNTFDMYDLDGGKKNVAVMFCHSTLDNVEVFGNTVTGNATGFIAFYAAATYYPTMNEGATFKVHDNILNGAKESVLWKTETEWMPTYYNA